MSKWRPATTECLYTIADIHGEADLLNKILKRILPLRKSDGIHDKIVFLGDYVDRHKDGHKVLDALIKLKWFSNETKDQEYAEEELWVGALERNIEIVGIVGVSEWQAEVKGQIIRNKCSLNYTEKIISENTVLKDL